jgi:hypothetical protein
VRYAPNEGTKEKVRCLASGFFYGQAIHSLQLLCRSRLNTSLQRALRPLLNSKEHVASALRAAVVLCHVTCFVAIVIAGCCMCCATVAAALHYLRMYVNAPRSGLVLLGKRF